LTEETIEMSERLAAVEARLVEACRRSGRSRDEVRLVAVSKTYGPERVEEAAANGLLTFGENRIQEARQKIPLCRGGLEWHLIGHLQRNKVRDAVSLFSMIHGVDSLRLLEAIDGAAAEQGRDIPLLLQVNIANEASKHGLAVDEVAAVLEAASALVHVSVEGLMTVPPFDADPEASRVHFAGLRSLRDRLAEQTGFPLQELSMGMSGDFEVAIEEGSTMVRVGAALFGPR
jgi:pyridoxal phosphate enzyme (YggS family)